MKLLESYYFYKMINIILKNIFFIFYIKSKKIYTQLIKYQNCNIIIKKPRIIFGTAHIPLIGVITATYAHTTGMQFEQLNLMI